MTRQVSVDRFGRILLPKDLRDRMGLDPGSPLEVEVDETGGEIRLRPVRGEPHLVSRGGVLVYSGRAAGDIDGAVESHRRGRLKDILR